MIQKRHIAPLLAGFMLLAACNKEQEPVLADTDGVPAGHLKLSVESPRPADGSKPLLDGLYTYWKNGDRVYVNGVENSVTVPSSALPYLTNTVQTPAAGQYYIATTFSTTMTQLEYAIPSGGTTYPVPFPYSYNYSRTSDGKVDLGSSIPMVAVADRTSDVLSFKHLTATVNVAITNGINSPFRVSSVEISSNAQLSEIRDVTFYQDGRVEVSSTEGQPQTGIGRHRKVTINFPSNTDVAYNETLNVPVPILPVVSGKELTITVTGTYPYGQPLFTVGSAYSSPGANSTATYTRTITLNSALNRNDYANANVQLKPSESRYFSSPVLDNWVTFEYDGFWERRCLWSTATNENRAGSFELTADHLENIMMPELSSSTASAAGSLLVWHQGEDRFKLLIFPHGTTLGQFPANVRPNVNYAGYTIKDYSNNGGMRGIPCVNNGTYEFLGSNTHVNYISLDLNNYSNYVTLDVPRVNSSMVDGSTLYDPQSSTGYSKKRTYTKEYECKYKNMTVSVVEKKEEVHEVYYEGGMIANNSVPISTKKEVTFSTTRQDNLNPSSRALYGLRAHN